LDAFLRAPAPLREIVFTRKCEKTKHYESLRHPRPLEACSPCFRFRPQGNYSLPSPLLATQKGQTWVPYGNINGIADHSPGLPRHEATRGQRPNSARTPQGVPEQTPSHPTHTPSHTPRPRPAATHRKPHAPPQPSSRFRAIMHNMLCNPFRVLLVICACPGVGSFLANPGLCYPIPLGWLDSTPTPPLHLPRSTPTSHRRHARGRGK
jgi:hypothetical protein